MAGEIFPSEEIVSFLDQQPIVRTLSTLRQKYKENSLLYSNYKLPRISRGTGDLPNLPMSKRQDWHVEKGEIFGKGEKLQFPCSVPL